MDNYQIIDNLFLDTLINDLRSSYRYFDTQITFIKFKYVKSKQYPIAEECAKSQLKILNEETKKTMSKMKTEIQSEIYRNQLKKVKHKKFNIKPSKSSNQLLNSIQNFQNQMTFTGLFAIPELLNINKNEMYPIAHIIKSLDYMEQYTQSLLDYENYIWGKLKSE